MARLGLTVPANIVRVVGTNGKGTVASMVAAGLSAAGSVTGRFLSPHVESFTERVAVDGTSVTPAEVTAFVARAVDASARGGVLADLPPALHPAFFEWTLALALERFAAAGATWAVLEAGVGGRDDATSAVVAGPAEPPGPRRGTVALVVLTNVDLDHLDTLGGTVEAIAAEKAGAIAAGAPVVTGAVGPALTVVAAAAAERHARLYADVAEDPLFSVPGPRSVGPGGGTRYANARLAAAALRLLGVQEHAVAAAVSVPPLPGRGECFVIDGRTVILDGAHDPSAARRLVSELPPGYVLVFGSLARKQGAATLRVLEARASAVVVTEAAEGEGLERFASPSRVLERDPSAALDLALARAGPGGTVLIAGSLYLAGRLRPLVDSRSA